MVARSRNICVHCLKQVDSPEREHVFPKSWYPDSTPPNMPRWTVPACKPCNSEHGSIERDLLERMALCVDPDDPEFGDLARKGLRALDPGQARNKRDANARAARRKAILSETVPVAEVPFHLVIPNFAAQGNAPPGGHIGVLVPADLLKRLALKLVRGIALHFDGLYINLNEVEFTVRSVSEPVAELDHALHRWGRQETNGPGISVSWAVVQEDKRGRMHYIEVWRQWKFYAFTRPTSRDPATSGM